MPQQPRLELHQRLARSPLMWRAPPWRHQPDPASPDPRASSFLNGLMDEATCKVGWVLIANRRKGKAADDEEVPSRGMKGHHLKPLLPSPAAMAKRLCTGMAAAVAALVVCSVLLPLAFLLGLHRTGHGSEERTAVIISTELGLGKHMHLDGGMRHKLLKKALIWLPPCICGD